MICWIEEAEKGIRTQWNNSSKLAEAVDRWIMYKLWLQ